MKTQPISFRPSQSLDARLRSLSERTGVAKSRLVEQLTDEAERLHRYPGLGFRDSGERRRAWVLGSPFDVWEVIEGWQDLHEDADVVREQLGIDDRQLRLALAYYREFPEEIDRALALNRRSLEELEAAYPFMEVLRVDL